jgi:putative redox protein
MPADRFDFPNGQGQRLAGLLDLPSGPPRAYALFAHCFTCGKDIRAAQLIAEALTALGIAVLRFDFTGLGGSEGEFANSTFSSNVSDLIAACAELRRTRAAPAILIGHSLGGAAMLAAAGDIPEARAVVTIGAPSDPGHVTGLFKERLDELGTRTDIDVVLAGRSFRIGRDFVEDVRGQVLSRHISSLRKALLIFHSPEDAIVGIDNASTIFMAAKHPKSFVSLAGADHLLSRRRDASYVANVLAAWAERYLDVSPLAPDLPEPAATVVVRETRGGKFQQEIRAGRHRLLSDEPPQVGGSDSGPSPYDLLLGALGACTSMTLRLYAENKALALRRVTVRLSHSRIHAADCETCETQSGMLDRIERSIELDGDLDDAQRVRLLEIADKCPVHRTLTSEIDIRTSEFR